MEIIIFFICGFIPAVIISYGLAYDETKWSVVGLLWFAISITATYLILLSAGVL